ncbi:DUF6241 domain-containing protein [Ornithinibacillus halotolerans]|uniref:Uncharacterized protein n=1 Tax=Ornithinibacillus halotolerans TaxID=1274357 RepID=A0A916S617_9BACI|nr:DUF6241 domain-containing protein [Ornithinibacillus halotolerans]GGA82314.1 hypothetical protein GCM10008025_26940 [Ornithinibacillus halotolerans]
MKKLIIFLIIVATLSLGYFGYLILSDMEKTNEKRMTESNIEDIRDSTGGAKTDEEIAAFKEQGLNPFGQHTPQDKLTDTDYQEYIHGMSHQKVKAEQKWGFYQINEERINWLLEGLDLVKLNHEHTYRTILEKWAKGDFSTADDDHNAIWQLQGGTIGRATGILSPEEEKAYIRSQR